MNPKTTVAIPLYKSAKFIDTITNNIKAISLDDVEILISDRHCLDDTIDRLAEKFKNDKRIRFLKAKDEIDWVDHINELLKEAKGKYFRFLPHDDYSTEGSLENLINVLDTNEDAIVAYGGIIRVNQKGEPIDKEIMNLPSSGEKPYQWTLDVALKMYWKIYFHHSFKGLIRMKPVIENNLFIEKTSDTIYSDTCWRFALCLLGKFIYVPDSVLIKSMHSSSVSANWNWVGKNVFSASVTMNIYLYKLIKDKEIQNYCSRDIFFNARRLAYWLDNLHGPRPEYLPLDELNSSEIRAYKLPSIY